jgi:hypothetical protein
LRRKLQGGMRDGCSQKIAGVHTWFTGMTSLRRAIPILSFHMSLGSTIFSILSSNQVLVGYIRDWYWEDIKKIGSKSTVSSKVLVRRSLRTVRYNSQLINRARSEVLLSRRKILIRPTVTPFCRFISTVPAVAYKFPAVLRTPFRV